jgi:type II secretory pathway component PulF
MSFIVTPGQFSQRAAFYQQLAQLTGAGIGLLQGLEHLEKNPPARSYRVPLGKLRRELGSGFTFTESLRRIPGWLPPFDIALIEAGEHSGRLDACFRLLSDYYTDRARLTRQVIADLMYPVFLFHFAVFIFPFSQLFMTGNWLMYLAQTFGILLPIYLFIGVMIFATQSRHGETWRAWVESVLRPIPILGTARHCLALSRLAAALEALLNAGVTVIQAWEMAAAASGSPALRKTVLAWRPLVDGGLTPAEVVRTSPRFPVLFSNQYTTGEVSGKLDETLKGLHRYYQEEGSRKLHALAQWTPRLVYILVALMIAYRIIGFWTNYFNQIRNIGGF